MPDHPLPLWSTLRTLRQRLTDPATAHEDDAGHGGLAADLAQLQTQALVRRRALGLIGGGAGALWLAACGGGGGDAGTSTGTSTSTGTTTGTSTGSTGSSTTCTLIPEETAGPYPGDGSNSVGGSIANALALSGIVRSDIRSSIAGASGVASGVPLRVVIELVNTNASCAALAGYAIYLWHCDAAGRYSMYSSGVTTENYLRGVQATGSDGVATFTTIYPGCYSGRMPHLHFEVYRSATTASAWTNKLRTSQMAFPNEISSAVYTGSSVYAASVANLAAISFASDNVFSDGVSTQLATVSGSVTAGFEARLRVGIGA